MAQHQIVYSKVIQNMKEMINLLEFDAMRSPGKAKMNSQHLHSLHFLVDMYEAKVAAEETTVKKTKAKAKKADADKLGE